MYNNYSSSWVKSYKQGFIFGAFINGNEVIKVQVDKFAYVVYVKSVHAAKIMISKHINNYGG